ncbi:MAG: 1-acyl-sn-glycerol-3-phosphate acyltransferase [Deltaproteobacteria bacterium]|nr:1-acyl-sn-glycerol-3-phosphate acyltransferase [Deltaproteobacteria bacterium]
MQLLLILVFFVYLMPLVKLLHLMVRSLFFLAPVKVSLPQDGGHGDYKKPVGKRVSLKLLHLISRVEYIVAPLRHWFVGIPFVVFFITVMTLELLGRTKTASQNMFLLDAVLVLFFWSVYSRQTAYAKAAEFLRSFPLAHAEDFLVRFQFELTFGGIDFFHSGDLRRVDPEYTNFKKGIRPLKSRLVFLKGLIDTVYLAHICLFVFRRMGAHYLFNLFDGAAAYWGQRMLMLTHSCLAVNGIEALKEKRGRFIFIFNHKSAFDFILAFFALSTAEINGRRPRLRFILAKDHFRDNPLVYRLFGVGRVCEAAKMIFIARRDRTKSSEDLKRAARIIVNNEIDVAIFPQGTRAKGNCDRAFKRRDAGFYTTINKKDPASQLSHIKKGTSYLVWDTLYEMHQTQRDDELHLVFVGINGTASILPKGKTRVQTMADVQFTVGDVVTLTPQIIEDCLDHTDPQAIEASKKEFLSEINSLINQKLVSVLQLHDLLVQRYLTELKGQFRLSDEKILSLRQNILELSERGDVVYILLDRIYGLPVPQWNGYLSQLTHFLLEKSEYARFINFLEEISFELLKNEYHVDK